ncbi:MAG TPA: hypothetical protein VFQ35_15930, partial [Polyangiaceae bacterium]|nr:hypothetical protein [Polyangiaceae bacterium]
TVAVSRAATRGITEELGATDATNANGRAGSSRIDALAKQLSNAFAVGFEDAVDRSMVRRNQGHERDAPVLASLGRAATTSFDILSLGGAIAVLLFLGLVGALVALFVRARRYRRESELRDNVLSNLLRLHPELTSREVHAGS